MAAGRQLRCRKGSLILPPELLARQPLARFLLGELLLFLGCPCEPLFEALPAGLGLDGSTLLPVVSVHVEFLRHAPESLMQGHATSFPDGSPP